MKRKIIRTILIILVLIILIVAGYFGYAYAAYYRVEDNQALEVQGQAANDTIDTETEFTIVSANLGFGAYSSDYTFFMDGGKESWAFSKEDVYNNISNSIDIITSVESDITLLQEIDVDGTRSYHINQYEYINNLLSDNGLDSSSTFAQNYDSPFLIIPLYQPHGKNKAGIMTLSSFTIQDSIRKSLPIEQGFSKFYDLDRCYSKNYINVSGSDKQLVLYNVHLSAYTTNPATAEAQIKMLNEDMMQEYNKGNYCIAGGDMNKDLLGDSTKYFNSGSIAANWAKAFPVELLSPELKLVAPFNEASPVPSCRNADVPYSPDNFVLTVDGFIISDNVTLIESDVINSSFAFSDHNPVYMRFSLQ